MYASRQDMTDAFGADELVQRTDRGDPPAGVIDDAVLGRALDDATSFIDGNVGKAYALPAAVVSPALRRVACDVARYYLYEDGPTEAVQRRYDDAVKWLDGVSKGTILLDAPAAEAEETAGSVETVMPPRRFSRETLRGL